MLGAAALDLKLAVRYRGGDDKRAGLDTVGYDRVLGTAEPLDTLYLHHGRSGTLYPGTHFV